MGRPGVRQHPGGSARLPAPLLSAGPGAALSRAASPLDEARWLLARGEPTAAWECLLPLLSDSPDAAVLLTAARARADLREPLAALELTERAVAAAPGSVEARDARARCLHALGRNVEALAVAESARELLEDPANAAFGSSVYLTLVWCLRDLRRYREALAAAEHGLARWPDAVLAQWASQVEEDLAEAEAERC